MRKSLLYFLTLGLLVCLFAVTMPEAKAAEDHVHCVCGGHANGVGDHVCSENITWEPWDGTTALQDGHSYYLNDTDGDGVITLSTTLTIEKKHVSICLNGVELTSTERTILLRGASSGTQLSICDCKNTGSVSSTNTGIAPVLHSFTSGRNEVTINLYSGNLIAKDNDRSTDSDAGVLRVGNNTADPGSAANRKATFNMYAGSISGGMTKKSGGNVFVSVDCEFNLYGGTVSGGQAGTDGGNFVVDGHLNLQGGTVTNGSANSHGGGIYIKDNGKVTVGGNVRVEGNKGSNVYLPAGKTLTVTDASGAYVGVTTQDEVFAHANGDFSKNFFFDDSAGAVMYGDGKLCRVTPARITMLSIQPSVVGIGYKAMFEIPENVRSQVVSYGYDLWLEGYPVRSYAGQKALTDNLELTLRVKNVMTPDNDLLTNYNQADMQVNARAFVQFADGTRLESPVESYDLRQMLEQADAYYSTFSDDQTDALQSMYSDYKNIMLGWDLPNIIHSSSTWTDLTQSNFATQIVKSGQYRLTEDVDLADSTISISANRTVTLCLNGHTISGNARLFKVYGTLNICDCHADDREGTLTSSYAGDYAPVAYLYQASTMNLYGGNLTATGKVKKNAGVLAVGNTNGMDCRLNMFGGRIYGGRAAQNAALVWVLNTSTFNMYGGELYDGIADGSGGAIHMGGSCTSNLYGGEIYGCTAAESGGGVYASLGSPNLYLGENLTICNNTAVKGGNVYYNGDKELHIDGSVITGGIAENYGGGVYCAHGSVALKGNTVIRDNTQGNLYLPAQIPLDATALSASSEVYLYNMSAMTLRASKYLKLERSDYKVATVGGQTVVIPESFTVPTDVEGFQVGYGRSDITPTETGLPLAGYGNAASRLSTTTAVNVYDELKVSCVAITDEQGETVLLMSVDLIRPGEELMDTIFPAITAATGVPESHIFTTFTHTHSVPETKQITNPKIQRYNAMLPDKFAESANLAMADRAAATMETGSFEVGDYGKQLNFTRHYQYEENGVVKYFGDNFGTQTVNSTTKHVTEADRTMHLVKFTRDGKDILMANWRVHPHMTGGGNKTYVSADLIGTTRYHFERENPDCHFIYLQGAAGNINETSKIKAEQHGYTYFKYGEDLADQMQAALNDNCLAQAEVGLWQVDNYSYTATADIATEDEYQHAKAASDAFNAWLAENPNATSTEKKAKCEELGYLTWFHFNNVITRHGLNETYQLPLNTFSLGSSLAFFTAPGELWDTVSMEIEEASKFPMTLCIGYSQDHFNYFVYDPNNGGEMTYESYESNNYRFVAPKTINDFIAYWKAALDDMYEALDD